MIMYTFLQVMYFFHGNIACNQSEMSNNNPINKDQEQKICNLYNLDSEADWDTLQELDKVKKDYTENMGEVVLKMKSAAKCMFKVSPKQAIKNIKDQKKGLQGIIVKDKRLKGDIKEQHKKSTELKKQKKIISENTDKIMKYFSFVEDDNNNLRKIQEDSINDLTILCLSSICPTNIAVTIPSIVKEKNINFNNNYNKIVRLLMLVAMCSSSSLLKIDRSSQDTELERLEGLFNLIMGNIQSQEDTTKGSKDDIFNSLLIVAVTNILIKSNYSNSSEILDGIISALKKHNNYQNKQAFIIDYFEKLFICLHNKADIQDWSMSNIEKQVATHYSKDISKNSSCTSIILITLIRIIDLSIFKENITLKNIVETVRKKCDVRQYVIEHFSDFVEMSIINMINQRTKAIEAITHIEKFQTSSFFFNILSNLFTFNLIISYQDALINELRDFEDDNSNGILTAVKAKYNLISEQLHEKNQNKYLCSSDPNTDILKCYIKHKGYDNLNDTLEQLFALGYMEEDNDQEPDNNSVMQEIEKNQSDLREFFAKEISQKLGYTSEDFNKGKIPYIIGGLFVGSSFTGGLINKKKSSEKPPMEQSTLDEF